MAITPEPNVTGTVFIVDDDANFARGLARLIGAAGWQAQVFGSAADFLAHARIEEVKPGCVVLDVKMPGMPGPELHRAMVAREMDIPVIFLTGHGDVPTSVDAMKLGAIDFLEKPVLAERLTAAIRVAFGRHEAGRLRREERREIEARLESLTPREREVMAHVIAGRLNKQIASDLGISIKTVKAHRAKMMHKMHARSVAALVDLCREAGIHAAVPAAPA
jgi:FixJ family two-component response regulator